jgi:hypothetical protein
MADDPHGAPPLSDLECPDCATTIDVGDEPRATADGGDDLPRAGDDRPGLRGVDVRCEDCDAEVGLYFFP